VDRLSRDILERIARELGRQPDDPKVLQVVYRLVWELATGEPATAAKRQPNPLLPAKDDPALRKPDHQDLTDLVDSILEDPTPKTEFLARPEAVEMPRSTGVWLKDLLTNLKSEPPDSPRRKKASEWVPAPAKPPVEATNPLVDLARETSAAAPAPPAGDLAAPAPPAPAVSPAAPHAAPPRPHGPRFARRSARGPEDADFLTKEQAAKVAPAWLISLAVHFVAAVVLMNIVYFTSFHKGGDIFRVSISMAPESKLPPPALPKGPESSGPPGNHDEDSGPGGRIDPNDPNPAGVKLPEIPKDVTAPSISLNSGPQAPGTGTSGRLGLGGIYEGRGGKGRKAALEKYGGDEETEAAVARGLKWLAVHQTRAGAWGGEWGIHACHVDPPCSTMGAMCPVGVTGLCLLAFLGAGFTHHDGPEGAYTDVVRRGAEYLLSRQTKEGRFEEVDSAHNYSHCTAMLAIAELYGMTQDPVLRPPLMRAIEYLEIAQQEHGGWDYNVGRSNRGDISISGWVVMALRACRAAGLPVNDRVWKLAQNFYAIALDSSVPWFPYEYHAGPTVGVRVGGTYATQASAILARNYLGMKSDGALESKISALLVRTPPHIANPPKTMQSDWRFSYYYTYYATLVMFYGGGDAWRKWNSAMKREMLSLQSREGHTEGSFDPIGPDLGHGGRCYTTAMGIMCLEVYYRYLPSYKAEVDLLAPLDDGKGKTGGPRKVVTEETSSAELIEMLRHESMTVRRQASRELCRRKEAGALADLVRAATAETTSLKQLLVEDLAAFGEDPKALEALIGFLVCETPVQQAAVRALRRATGLALDTADDWREWWAKRGR
jgi:hypothetical protein